MKRIGLLGGSFNPVHLGHVLVATYAASIGRFDEILIMPTYVHVNGKKLIDYEHRVKMCELAFGYIPNVKVSRIERVLPTPSYTIQTIKYLQETEPASYRLIVGSDIIENTSSWGDLDTVLKLAPAFVVGRIGYPSKDAEIMMPGISSTDVRKYLQESRYEKELEASLPFKVLRYIQEHKLYVE